MLSLMPCYEKERMAKKVKYVVVDLDIDACFLVGDKKVLGSILGVSPRTIDRWFPYSNYMKYRNRFIIARDPLHITRDHRYNFSPEFLAKQEEFKKRKK
jgi:hypothetical protein